MNTKISFRIRKYFILTTRVLTLVALILNATAFPISIAQAQSGETELSTTGLISYWSFDEGFGTSASDIAPVGYGNTGTLENNPQWVPSPFGSALEFNPASDQYVSTLNNDDSLSIPSGEITITAWINASNVTGVHNIVVKDKEGTTSRGNYSLAIVDGKLRFGFSQASNYIDNWIDTQDSIAPNRWYFVAITHTFGNSGNIAVYLNGISQPLSGWDCDGGSSCDYDSMPATFAFDPLYIGKSICNGEQFDGLIDEVRIYNRVLSLEEIEYTPLSVGSPDNPIKIFFMPTGDIQAIFAGGQIMADYLNQATGLSFEVNVPDSLAETVYGICQNPDSSMGFVPGFGYVLASDFCGVDVSYKAIRFGLDSYWGEILVPRESSIQTLNDLNGLNWGIPDYLSASGYMAPIVMFNNNGVSPADIVETGSHDQAVMALYNGEVDFATTFFSPPIKPEGEPAWQPGDDPDIPDALVNTCDVSSDGSQLLCSDWQVMDGRNLVRNEAPDVVQELRILTITERIANDALSFGPDFPIDLRTQVENAMVAFADTSEWWDSIGSGDVYGWEGLAPAVDADYNYTREMVTAAGITLDNWGGVPDYNPSFSVRLTENQVRGYEWQLGRDVTLFVDGSEIDIQTVTEADWDPNQTFVWFDLGESLTLQAGQFIEMTDGTVTKTHIVTSLEVTGVDPDADTVFGTAEPDSQVDIGHIYCDETGCYGFRREFANSNSYWLADFSVVGEDDDEQDIVDLEPGMGNEARQCDEDGDCTTYNWQIPYPPGFAVQLDESNPAIHASGFEPDAPITITIDDPDTPENPDYTGTETMGSDGMLIFTLDYIVQPNDIVTLTDGINTASQRVKYLIISAIDAEADIISGTTEPFLEVHVWSPNDDNMPGIDLFADENGDWVADYAGVFDLTAGMDGFVEVRGEIGGGTMRYWQVLQPEVWAHPNDSDEDWIDVRDWAFGDTVYLTIDDDADPSNGVLYSDSGEIGPADWNPSVGVKEFHLGSFDLQPGHFVTVTGSTTTKDLIITNIDVTEINLELGTISGIADPGSAVQAWQHEEPCNSDVITDENGFWTVDFSQCNFGPGVGGGVGQKDADGDSTVYFWEVSNPNFSARIAENQVHGYEWPLGIDVTLFIDGNEIDTQTVTEADWDPSQTFVWFDLDESITLQAGQFIEMTDVTITKSHTVSSFEITGVDPDADTIFGTADPDSQINVGIHCWDCPGRNEIADATGNWVADYSVPGDEDWEDNTFDIQLGDRGEARECDEDGDCTQFEWYLSNPTFGVRANDDRIEGWEWPDGATLTITVDDPGTLVNPDAIDTVMVGFPELDPNQTWFELNLWNVIDIQPGFVVTVADDVTTKEHTVLDLTFTDIDIDADIVYGNGQPDSPVNVWTCDDFGCINREEFTNQDGDWSVDFRIPGDQDWEQETADLQYGSWIDSSQHDEDGDQTMFGMNIPSYSFTFFTAWNGFVSDDWPLNVPIQLTADDPDTIETQDFQDEIYSQPAPWDPSRTWLIYEQDPSVFLFEPGFTLTLDNGQIQKSLIISSIQISDVDVDNNIVSGFAEPNVEVNVSVDDNARRYVASDGNGFWSADFSETGNGGDGADILYDIGKGSQVNAQVSDDDGDSTMAEWYVLSYTLHAVPTHPEVHGHDWPQGGPVTLIIDSDTDLGNGTLYEATRNVDEDPWCGNPCFDLYDVFDLQVGQYVTMTDGDVSKTVQVSMLTVTEVDYVNDILRGNADEGSTVQVNIWSQEGISRTVQADDGTWMVDFSEPGTGENELVTDIHPGDWGRAIQHNPDGSDDGTLEYWTAGSTFSGTVYLIEVAPENGIGGVLVEACTPENFCRTTLTDGAGNYRLDGLAAGSYTIRAIPPGTNIPGTIGPVDVSYDEDLVGLDITVQEPPSPPPSQDAVEPSHEGGGTISVFIGDPLTLTTYGDPGGMATFAIVVLDDGYTLTGSMDETPAGSGTYIAEIDPLAPHHGAAQITYTITYPDKPPVEVEFFIYIDPSGVVQTVDGVPIVDATITLLRSDNPEGPFEVVPDGSVVMSPSNRTNPDVTDEDGRYGWDVVAGFYIVRAEFPGCFSPDDSSQLFVESEVLTIPPPVTDLVLVLDCPNLPPKAYAGADKTVNEGAEITLDGSGSFDPEGEVLTYEWDLDNDGVYDDASGAMTTMSFSDQGIYTVGLQVSDPGGLTDTDVVEVEVLNVAPHITSFTAPVAPVQIGESVDISAFFIDPGLDTHTAQLNWGDETSSAGTVNGYFITDTHAYSIPGVYTLTLTVSDEDSGVATEYFQYVVIYDPEGGFVTGGGWIWSPEGAYVPDPSLTGKANFGFVSKYKKGANVPTGNTEFQFKAADLNFKSTSYDWLVIAGTKAMYKGTGTINGEGEYGFMLSAIDGSPDKFRIKIWDRATEAVVYDNQLGVADDTDPVTELGGGSIVIHKAK